MTKATTTKHESLWDRLWTPHVGKMFIRNTVVSTGTFLISLALMAIFVQWFHMGPNWASGISFLAATTTHYFFGRKWIFAGSKRSVGTGYVYFLITAGIGTVVTVWVFNFVMVHTHLHYLMARIIASIFAGLAMFIINVTVNFKEA